MTIFVYIQAIIALLIVILFLTLQYMLVHKKNRYNFSRLADDLSCGSLSASNIYHKSKGKSTHLMSEYSSGECEYGTITVIADTIQDDVYKQMIRQNLVQYGVVNNLRASGLSRRDIKKVLLEKTDDYKDLNFINSQIRINSIKRVDLALADRDIRCHVDSTITVIDDRSIPYMVKGMFDITYGANWYVVVNSVAFEMITT